VRRRAVARRQNARKIGKATWTGRFESHRDRSSVFICAE
jgi:hypothetical protein